MKRLLFVLGAAVCATACFAVADDVGDVHHPARMDMRFYEMDQHLLQLFEFRIVDRNNFTHTHGKMLPLRMTKGQFKVSVPHAVPPGETGYRLDFWADENGDLTYTFDHDWPFPRLDHSWRILLDDAAPRDPFATFAHADEGYQVGFTHHLDFVDLWEFPDRQLPRIKPNDTGVDAIIEIRNLPAHDGRLGQIRVADPSGHVVGLFRFTASAQVEWKIEGCIEPGNFYDVDLYIDANGDNDSNGNGYDNPAKGPGNDLGWRLVHQQADKTGLHVSFDAATAGNVDVGIP